MRRSRKIYEYYVCPYCFRTVDKCKCDYYPPWTLIIIDKAIQEHIQILNDKGYKTISCCESHFGGNSRMYISFNHDYDHMELPNNFKYDKRKHSVFFDMNRKLAEQEFEKSKTEKIVELLEWCKTLPDLN